MYLLYKKIDFLNLNYIKLYIGEDIDGYYRDLQGRIMAPLLMFKRNNIDRNRELTNKLDANQPHNIAVTGKKYGKLSKEHKNKIGQANKISLLKYKYDIVNIQTQEIFENVSINEFCRTHNLTSNHLHETLPEHWKRNKKVTQHKGYRIIKKYSIIEYDRNI